MVHWHIICSIPFQLGTINCPYSKIPFFRILDKEFTSVVSTVSSVYNPCFGCGCAEKDPVPKTSSRSIRGVLLSTYTEGKTIREYNRIENQNTSVWKGQGLGMKVTSSVPLFVSFFNSLTNSDCLERPPSPPYSWLKYESFHLTPEKRISFNETHPCYPSSSGKFLLSLGTG